MDGFQYRAPLYKWAVGRAGRLELGGKPSSAKVQVSSQ